MSIKYIYSKDLNRIDKIDRGKKDIFPNAPRSEGPIRKKKSEALFMNHLTSYSTLEGDVT